MATGGLPNDLDRPTRGQSNPRSKRRGPAESGATGFDGDLSLNSELQRAEDQVTNAALPNNLGWSGSKQQTPPRDSNLPRFSRMPGHTPATLPRIKPTSNASMKRRLSYTEESEEVDTSRILQRLKQVKDFLKQATSMYQTMQSSEDNRRASDVDQMGKLARLIKHLKDQEKAYIDLLQRSLTVQDTDPSQDKTPTASVQSVTDGEQSDAAQSEANEELEGLRKQHKLLSKMLEQQKELRELQSRQTALLKLQKAAETQLAEAEEEGRQIAAAVQIATDQGFISNPSNAEQQAPPLNQQIKNRPGPARPATDSESENVIDNEDAALAIADAAQQRLVLESKLMALQAKKEKMDHLLRELQCVTDDRINNEPFREASTSANVNEIPQEDDDMANLATTSSKHTRSDEDQKMLEALEKLNKLQEVRDRLKQLKDMVGFQEQCAGALVDHPGSLTADQRIFNTDQDAAQAEPSSQPAQLDADWMLNFGADDPELRRKLRQLKEARERVQSLRVAAAAASQQASTSRADEVDQQSVHTQTEDEEESEGEHANVDGESTSSQASSQSWQGLAWQDDPEFQEKVGKLKAAKSKLKQLQDLIGKVQGLFPEHATLPPDLAELSFSEAGDDDDDDEDDYDEDEEDGEDNEDDNNNQDETGDGDSTCSDESTTGSEANQVVGQTESDQEAAYQDRLNQQREELSSLLEERRRLEKVQQELSSLAGPSSPRGQSQGPSKISKQTGTEEHGSTSLVNNRLNTRRGIESGTQTSHDSHGLRFRPTVATKSTSPINRQGGGANSNRLTESATQTTYQFEVRSPRSNISYSVDSSEPVRAAPVANNLLWSELRRQRELHEEKLKKRKQRLVFEKKKRTGFDDISEGGTYSVHSGDIDEGFGVSMMSADITTATWGGSTQPSSTQNDSAVSEDGSAEDGAENPITVEVADDYPDGIVQAEEEEEENSETDAFPTEPESIYRQRERSQRFGSGLSRPFSGKKRKLNGRAMAEPRRKGRGHKTTVRWPSLSDSPRQRQENFTPAADLMREARDETQSEMLGYLDEHRKSLAHLLDELKNVVRPMQSPQPPPQHNLNNNTAGMQSFYIPQSQSPAFQNYPPPNFFTDMNSYLRQTQWLAQQQMMLQNLHQGYQQLQLQYQEMNQLQQSMQQLFSKPFQPPAQNSGGQNMQAENPFNFSPAFNQYHAQQQPFQFGLSQPSTSTSNAWGGQDTEQLPPVSSSNLPEHFYSQMNEASPNVHLWCQKSSQNEEQSQAQLYQSAVPAFTPPLVRISEQFPVSSLASGEIPFSQASQYMNPPSSMNTSSSAGIIGQPIINDTIGTSFPTPARAAAASALAQHCVQTGFSANPDPKDSAIETGSVSSLMSSSIPGDVQENMDRIVREVRDSKSNTEQESDAQSNFSLFEALRDNIYSEVATLISQNESRPHFLLELFRELQLLTSDYLRQRALYSLQDLVSKFLTDDTIGNAEQRQKQLLHVWGDTNSELTPSESIETLEDIDDTKMSSLPQVGYDYAEVVESGSTMSTPGSSIAENPFASDGLGDTVIHLDRALRKMRETELSKAESEGLFNTATNHASKSTGAEQSGVVRDDVTTSSAGDVGSDSSVSDIQYPHIDTQALDNQIKDIMSEVIPHLNEHLEDTCNPQLLSYIKRIVLGMIKINETGKEFARFFYKQLESILQDSLSKFKGQKLKSCGEDLLVEISEVLFNELAFFKLMQDLDSATPRKRAFWKQRVWQSPLAAEAMPKGNENREADLEDESSDDDEVEDEEGEEGDDDSDDEEEEDEEEEEEEEDDGDRAEGDAAEEDIGERADNDKDQDSRGESATENSEEEDDQLPTARAVVNGAAAHNQLSQHLPGRPNSEDGAANQDANNQIQCVVQLSVSESKPFASTGSGDEDENDETSDANKAPEDENGAACLAHAQAASNMANAPAASSTQQNGETNGQYENEVTVDDLPTKLTGLTEADLQARMTEEQNRSEGISGILSTIGTELAGDSSHLPEPENDQPETSEEVEDR